MKFYYASPEPDRLSAELRAISKRGVAEEHTHRARCETRSFRQRPARLRATEVAGNDAPPFAL